MAKKQKQMGRPVLPEGEAKKVIVQTRVSEDERDMLQQAATKAGVSFSRWMRDRLKASASTELRNK